MNCDLKVELPGKGGKDTFQTNERPTKSLFSNKVTLEILEAVRKGDHEAFATIYLHYVDPVSNFLGILLHSAEDAEELCQQIFVKIWENRGKIDPQSNFHGYLYRMTRSAALKHLAHKKVKDKYLNFVLTSEPEMGVSPDEIIVSNEMSLLISLCLNNMPEQRRRVFEMSRFKNLSHDEIAERLGISRNTVRAHIYNALKELKELVALLLFFFTE